MTNPKPKRNKRPQKKPGSGSSVNYRRNSGGTRRRGRKYLATQIRPRGSPRRATSLRPWEARAGKVIGDEVGEGEADAVVTVTVTVTVGARTEDSQRKGKRGSCTTLITRQSQGSISNGAATHPLNLGVDQARPVRRIKSYEHQEGRTAVGGEGSALLGAGPPNTAKNLYCMLVMLCSDFFSIPPHQPPPILPAS